MFNNLLKMTLRQMARYKSYTVINIAGLAIGIAVCFMIVMWVKDEYSYDRFHNKADRIYRVLWEARYGDNEWKIPLGPVPLGPSLKREFPEVEAVAQLYAGGITLKKDNEFVREQDVLFVDPSFVELFTLEVIAGDPAAALKEPNAIVLTEETANRYFGEKNPLGQSLERNDGHLYQVKGIVRAFPSQSHFQFDFLAPLKELSHMEQRATQWSSAAVYNYFLLKQGAEIATLEDKWADYIYEEVAGEEFRDGTNYTTFPFQALTDIHLHSNLEYELSANGNINYVYIFSVVAAIILMLAAINFINLSTARGLTRAKEVGIRKVLGSQRRQLFWRFFGESFLYVALAIVVALVLVRLALPYFNELAEKEMALDFLGSPFLWLLLAGLAIAATLLSGAFPAAFLASFPPAQSLKGELVEKPKQNWLRRGLVVSQFCISAILIIGSLVAEKQLRFLQNQNLGFDKEHVLVINRAQALGNNYVPFLQHLKAIPSVKEASIAQYLPGKDKEFDSTIFVPEQPANYQETSLNYTFVDPQYLDVLQLELAAGRNFSPELATDSAAVLINEAAARKLGWEEPLGKQLRMGGREEGLVIGVVKDFHFRSLHHEIEPIVMLLTSWNLQHIAVRLQAGNHRQSIETIKAAWEESGANAPFDHTFLSEDYARLYNSEERMAQVFKVFSILAILIACLGLFGLAAFMAVRRTKEIGIRKILGASVAGIVGLLSKDFLRLVLIALAIAAPIAWLSMNRWLQGFAYRTSIDWRVFLLAGGLAVGVAFLTISFQSFKAATGDPADALRSE